MKATLKIESIEVSMKKVEEPILIKHYVDNLSTKSITVNGLPSATFTNEQKTLCGLTIMVTSRKEFVTQLNGIGECNCDACISKFREIINRPMLSCENCEKEMDDHDIHDIGHMEYKRLCIVCKSKVLRREMVESFNKRIKREADVSTWEDYDIGQYSTDPELDLEGLNEYEQFCLYVYAWSKEDFAVFKRAICKFFGWSPYKVAKLYRELKPLKVMEVVPTFSEETGLISGNGYMFDYEYALKKV